jgi:cytochrome c biogenesis factor
VLQTIGTLGHVNGAPSLSHWK